MATMFWRNFKTAPRYLRFALPAHVPEILIQPIHNLKSLDSIYSLSETGAYDEQAALLSRSQTRLSVNDVRGHKKRQRITVF
jgi:hypothetical protein